MTRSDLFRAYPDEIVFDIIIVVHAWRFLPGILNKSMSVADVAGYDAAFAAMMLFFPALLWYAVPILKSLKGHDRKAASGIGSLLLFIVVIVPLIEGPVLLASHYGVNRHDIEGRFMLIGLVMVAIGLAAGNLMPLLHEKVIRRIGDPFAGKMISLGLVNAGGAAAACAACFGNLVMAGYFTRHSADPSGGFILSLFLSGVVPLRLIMMARPPARPVTILTGAASIALCVLAGLRALGRV